MDSIHRSGQLAVEMQGYSFLSTAPLGRGKFDAIVAVNLGRTFAVEFKSPEARGARAKLNEAQSSFFVGWSGEKHVVTSVPQLLDLCRSFPILCKCPWCVSQRSV